MNMIAKTKYFTFNTKKQKELIRITDEVDNFKDEAGLHEGFILVSAMHITAGVIVNDWEEGLHEEHGRFNDVLGSHQTLFFKKRKEKKSRVQNREVDA